MIDPRAILLANAGSGKTFTLANQIIAWSIADLRAGRKPEPWRMLAVTFTRKAAGEILGRILAHAALGAMPGKTGDDARESFSKIVGPATMEQYQAVLEALCDGLHRMQVGTLDGFFHRVAAALPAELGLPGEWTIGDSIDLKVIRARAAVEVLRSEHARELIDLLEEGAPKPSVLSAVGGLLGGGIGGNGGFGGNFGSRGVNVLDQYAATCARGPDAVERAWGWVARLLAREGKSPDGTHAAEYLALVQDFEDAPLPNTGGGKPHANWIKQRAACVERLRAKDLDAIAETNFFVKIVSGQVHYDLLPTDELRSAATGLAAYVRVAMLGRTAKRLEGARRVLPIASDAMARAKEEAGIYDFGDIVSGAASAARRAGSPVADPVALCAAIGVSIDDLALDEAQDTSAAQFLALRPIIERVLGVHERSASGRFLLVGDPKQSIYGWRGGVPGLIEHIRTVYHAHLGKADPLDESRRSSKLVMDFVNRVFGNLHRDLLPLVDAPLRADAVGLVSFLSAEGIGSTASASGFKRALDEWEFMPHAAHDLRRAGWIHAYACGTTPPAVPGGDEGELTAAVCAAEVAARIHRERPAHTVAILARSNDGVADAAAHLKSLGVPVSDEGRSSLLDSPAVVAMLAVVRLVDNPSDRIAHFLASHGAIASICGLAASESHGTPGLADAAAVRFATMRRREIADLGLAAYLRGLARALEGAGISERDRVRASRVVAIAEEFTDDPLPRLREFLDAVESEQGSAASGHKVRVMTVHASKGLEFDEVVLMNLDREWASTPSGWGVLALDPTEPPLLVAPLMDKSVRQWVPELGLIEHDSRRRALLDELSGLYVAITRAKSGVHLVMNREQGDKLPTGARLVLAAVDAAAGGGAEGEGAVGGGAVGGGAEGGGAEGECAEGECAEGDAASGDLLDGAGAISKAHASAQPSSSEPFWKAEFGAIPVGPARASKEGSGAAAPVPAAPLVVVTARAAAAAAPPSHHESRPWQFDPFKNDDIALRGVLVHECFREVETARDLATAEQRAGLVARAVRRAAVEKGEPVAQKLVDDASALLERVATGVTGRALRGGGDVRVRTELPFVRETGDGLVHGRIDRLELDIRDGKVVGATIIDFKTGAVSASASELDEIKRGYFDQLDGYAEAVEEMFRIPPSAIEKVLLFVDRDELERSRPAGRPDARPIA